MALRTPDRTADCDDIALRDFGLLVGALALARLASASPRPNVRRRRATAS